MFGFGKKKTAKKKGTRPIIGEYNRNRGFKVLKSGVTLNVAREWREKFHSKYPHANTGLQQLANGKWRVIGKKGR